ncbi:IS4 family transposase, partial [Microcoleus sp. AT9_B4]
MYHFSVAYQKGLASDLVKYFADEKNQDLGIVKLGMKTSYQANYFSFPWNSKKFRTIFFQ